MTGETLAALASERKLSKMEGAEREELVSALSDFAGLSGTDR